jgi:hypothetical protein
MKINIKKTDDLITEPLDAYIEEKLLPLAKFVKQFDDSGEAEIWLELGLVGAVLAAALVLALGWQATSPGSAGAFACAIAIASLSYGVWQGWWLCLLAMLALLSRQLTREPPPR